MVYTELLSDPRWQRKRNEVLERDSWKCKSCGTDKITLHVHHLAYFHSYKPWEYPLELMATLCVKCHDSEKHRTLLEECLWMGFKVAGFFAGDILCLATMIHSEDFRNELKEKLRGIQNGKS